MVQKFKQFVTEAKEVHPNGIHIGPYEKHDNKHGHKVLAVGHKLKGRIKVGEVLSSTEVDDAHEVGVKVKHIGKKSNPPI